jgi:hypothetical protein
MKMGDTVLRRNAAYPYLHNLAHLEGSITDGVHAGIHFTAAQREVLTSPVCVCMYVLVRWLSLSLSLSLSPHTHTHTPAVSLSLSLSLHTHTHTHNHAFIYMREAVCTRALRMSIHY